MLDFLLLLVVDGIVLRKLGISLNETTGMIAIVGEE
jgi:hypothetical protein